MLQEEGLWVGLGVGVIAGADEDVEFVFEMKSAQRGGDGFTRGSRDDGKGDAPVRLFDLLEDLGDGGELREKFVVEILFAVGDFFDGHGEGVTLVERGDDAGDGPSSPRVEEVFGEVVAAVFGEGLLPGEVVQGHGVGDGSVHVE